MKKILSALRVLDEANRVSLTNILLAGSFVHFTHDAQWPHALVFVACLANYVVKRLRPVPFSASAVLEKDVSELKGKLSALTLKASITPSSVRKF